MPVPRRDRRWTWAGRVVTVVILAGLGWYFSRVGWERASVIAGVVGLFAGFVLYGLKVAWGTRDRFGFFLSFGIVLAIALQAIMNIAVVTASMPTKGISLPLVSFGGSSLLFSMVGIGILLSIDAMRKKGIGGNKETGGEKEKP